MFQFSQIVFRIYFFNAMLVTTHKYMFYKDVLELCFLYFAIFTEYFNKIVSYLVIFSNLNTNAFCLLLREKAGK